MRSQRSSGRIVGLMAVLHLAVGLMAPFILLDRVRGSEGLLANAAGSPGVVRAAVLLLFAGSAIAIGVAVAAWPVLRQGSPALALWVYALAVGAFLLQAVDNAHLMTMLSLSQEFVKTGGARSELQQAVGLVAGTARKWAHYSYLLVVVSWMFLLFASLYRLRLVPRVLAGVGLLASGLQIAAVPLRVLLGHPPEMRLAVPLGPAYLAVAVWLLVKGFAEGTGPRGVEVGVKPASPPGAARAEA